MKIEDFISKIKNAKYGTLMTGSIKLKVYSNKEHTHQRICFTEKCHKCNRDNSQEVLVLFYIPCKLTIFQAGLLFYLFAYNKKPVDYAQYHKCIAGKEFIENIKAINGIQNGN